MARWENGRRTAGVVRLNADLLFQLAPPAILVNGHVPLQWTAPRNIRYTLESSADLIR